MCWGQVTLYCFCCSMSTSKLLLGHMCCAFPVQLAASYLTQSCTLHLQFGKVEGDTFVLDYFSHRITALQAFAISLTTFESKLLL